eukprot:gb/GECG01008136.1/.p1 GENE.gb/GECG01008136.1/~~gb/GECG01008136.1/.p1  ORF type:complete len:855 (+),score=103.16 gb/GECG01008136.1/:1-2565(+)
MSSFSCFSSSNNGIESVADKAIGDVWKYYFSTEKNSNASSRAHQGQNQGQTEGQPADQSESRISDDGRIKLAKRLAQFFRDQGKDFIPSDKMVRQTSVSINYDDLIRRCPLTQVKEDLKETPEDIISCIGISLCIIRAEANPSVTPARVIPRIQNVHPITSVRQLKSQSIGKFVSLRGNVVRVSGVRPLVIEMTFECATCMGHISCEFSDGKYEPPSKCNSKKCRSKLFYPIRDSAVTVDWQQIKVQELETDLSEPGRIPRTVDCELTHDLVDACVPGDVVTLAGTVKSMNTDVAKGKSASRARNLFLLYVDVNSISTQKLSDSVARGGVSATHFSEKELQAIRKIATHPDPFALVVASLCPTIFGNEAVKAGLALGLFGGSQKKSATENDADAGANPTETHTNEDEEDTAANPGDSSGNALDLRCDPHVLVVGDPGLGKSQMLRAAASLSPRGVYVSGTTASSTGLTVTMVRDSVTGEYGLEAGALVLSDQGICCIDEFDKIGSEYQALLEAMEQQRISIAKAGIVCSLSARTTILSAANPVGGHYDRCKTIAENLKMNTALLSRFDIVFILIDTPDKHRDMALSRHVMMLHGEEANRNSSGARSAQRRNGASSSRIRDTQQRIAQEDARLTATQSAGRSQMDSSISGEPEDFAQNLREAVVKIKDPVPQQLLRKYISYCRRYCNPQLSRGAAKILQNFYLELRHQHATEESTPITTRQLESLIRLAQARAKIELTNVVTVQHAKDVVGLLKEALVDAATDEYGVVDFSRNCSGMSMGKQVKSFVKALSHAASRKRNSMFTKEEMSELAKDMNLQTFREGGFDDFLDVLNQQNYLLKKGGRLYQLLTSTYDIG